MEIQSVKSIKSCASIRITSHEGVTVINACGIYDDLIEIIDVITRFKNFEARLY